MIRSSQIILYMKRESNQDNLSRLDCNYCPLQRTNLATTIKKKVWENQDLRFQINFIWSTWARREFQSSRRWTKKEDSFHRQRTYFAWLKGFTFFLTSMRNLNKYFTFGSRPFLTYTHCESDNFRSKDKVKKRKSYNVWSMTNLKWKSQYTLSNYLLNWFKISAFPWIMIN